MSYRCQVCGKAVGHGQPLRRHVLLREDGTIKQEVPVCNPCGAALEAGVSLSELRVVRPKYSIPQPIPPLAVYRPVAIGLARY